LLLIMSAMRHHPSGNDWTMQMQRESESQFPLTAWQECWDESWDRSWRWMSQRRWGCQRKVICHVVPRSLVSCPRTWMKKLGGDCQCLGGEQAWTCAEVQSCAQHARWTHEPRFGPLRHGHRQRDRRTRPSGGRNNCQSHTVACL